MNPLDFLAFLAEPGFVIAWYAAGIVGALWVVYDEYAINEPVPKALKWAWPIIVVFFSIIGVLLYLWCCRPPGIDRLPGPQRERAFRQYASPTPKKVIGSAAHCVGGDGLGIVTAMVLARIWSMAFWQEFWFEYVAGFLFGWFIFQYKAMRMMTDGALRALWLAGRAEFFSMMTVMAGMGAVAVMAAVTPLVVGQQPAPNTAALWGVAALGLLVGFVVTYPMNLMLVRVGWKHGTTH
jgi:uncharacterized protein DUF4396